MKTFFARISIVACALLLSACAASDLPGFQNAYRAYDVPQPLVERIKAKFQAHGLDQASVARDSTGRIQLTGTYRNEDEVDQAFTIVQSIVGIKSTSPFYPTHILQKRWERAAGQALDAYAHGARHASAMPVKRALVVGINHFADPYHLPDIQGADDAVVVQAYLKQAGYTVTALLNERATKANIEAAIARLGGEIGPNDQVFIYISSHGNVPVPTPAGQDQRKMSIMAYDSGDQNTVKSNDRTEILLHFQNHAVPDTLVQDLARKPSAMTRVVIDTCYSGDMLDDISDDSTTYILQTNGGRSEREGISLASWTGPAYTAKGIRFSDDGAGASGGQVGGAAAHTAVDRNRSGYQIITATSTNEESLGPKSGHFASPLDPGRTLRGSYFTQSLFDYLAHDNGQLDPAFRDAQRFTSSTAVEVSHGNAHQVPRQFSTIPAQQNDLFQ
ncbi:caspase domain-containing protein [Paraburkholderia caballeronis]|uniref:caspase family protein n=1 Tax=Paraburkholderia caballeronis TaxID=416943 RepID=UPI0010665087|nr:caspase family protein [Paraburkholderia caballeronis]TDV37352.1 caspase domain-containing protein [Paraburkholderia caballeronis]